MFHFEVQITEQEYYDYNVFVNTQSSHGKSQLNRLRVVLSIIIVLLLISFLVRDGFTVTALVGIVPAAIVGVLFLVFWPSLMKRSIKQSIKAMNKKGKIGFDPVYTLQFFEDRFCEITPEQKSDILYAKLESVSVNADKAIYLHIDRMRGYILPLYAFDSTEQIETFLAFLTSKGIPVNTYE